MVEKHTIYIFQKQFIIIFVVVVRQYLGGVIQLQFNQASFVRPSLTTTLAAGTLTKCLKRSTSTTSGWSQQERGSVTIEGRFSDWKNCIIYFRRFKQTYQFLQQICVKKCTSSVRWWDSKPHLSEQGSIPITTPTLLVVTVCSLF